MLKTLWRSVSRRLFDRAVGATVLLDHVLRGFGPVYRTESELRAGTFVLNDDREILPALARATGLNISLYLGNRRIAVAGLPDGGTPAELGGYADATLVDTCLRRGELFRGVLEQQDRRHLVACRPIVPTDDPEGHGAIGMIEAFADEAATYEGMVAAAEVDRDDADLPVLRAHAEGLEEIVRFIDDVARRLQLLALNGNIIAAQAGEHGSAFRVVCRELSGLADRSKDAVSGFRKLMSEMGLNDDDVVDPRKRMTVADGG